MRPLGGGTFITRSLEFVRSAGTRKNVQLLLLYGMSTAPNMLIGMVAGQGRTNMKTSQNTLFVIDDDPKSRKAVAALASSLKITCETFASAEGFLDRCDSSLTGCALVDFRLDGMDGLQLQERLHAMGSGLSVILISAYADMSLAVRA